MSTKEKILEKASELFAQCGYQEASIRKIAKAANANSAMINYYFGSKQVLYESVLSLKMDEFMDEVSKIDTQNEKEFLREFIRIHINTIKKRGKFVSYLMLKESATDFKQVESIKKKYFEPLAQIVLKVIKSGIEKKIFKSYDENMILQLLIGINVMLALKNEDAQVDQLGKMAYDVFFFGICL